MKMCATTTYECICAIIMPFFPFFSYHMDGLVLVSRPCSFLHKFIFCWIKHQCLWRNRKDIRSHKFRTEVNYVYFNHLTLLNEQIYLIDSISIFQMAKLELFVGQRKSTRSQQLLVLQSDTMIFRWAKFLWIILISKIFRLNGVGKIWFCQPRTLVPFILHQI